MDQVKVGIIGAGRMGERHCRVYSNMRKVQLVGVCDSSQEQGEIIANKYDVTFFKDIEDLLSQVDAVSLATPTPLHFDQAMLCISKGIHTLIEKPIAETLAQAEALYTKAEENDLIVQIGHIERFNPAYIELKNTLMDELPPLVINVRRLSPYKGSNVDVDVVLDLMIHDTNLILDLVTKKPIDIDAYGLTAFSGTVDHAVAHLTFENGPILTMTASRVTEHKVRSIDVTSREAYLECDLLNKNISIHRSTMGEYINYYRRGVKYRQESIVERINIPTFEPLFLELQHFSDCILENRTPAVTARDGFEAMYMATQIRETILNKMVNMDRRRMQQRESSEPIEHQANNILS
jgi:predicted dehydrogenase